MNLKLTFIILLNYFLFILSTNSKYSFPNIKKDTSPSTLKYNKYLQRKTKNYLNNIIKNNNNIIKLKSGILIEKIKNSINIMSKSPKLTDRCKVSYIIQNKEGEIIEKEKMILRPAEIPIQSWGSLYTLMVEGDLWRAYIPPELAYGEYGREKLPPYSLLIIDLELFLVMGPGKSRDEARKAFEDAILPTNSNNDNDNNNNDNNNDNEIEFETDTDLENDLEL